MAADPYDEGRGKTTASGAARGRASCGYERLPSDNPTAKGGRGDGTEPIRDTDATEIPHSSKMRGAAGAVNPSARTGRPDADMNAPRRSYSRAKSGSTNDITDVSASKVHTTKSAKEL